MIIENEYYSGRGMLSIFLICLFLVPLTFTGFFWANSERLSFLDKFEEITNRPEYPYVPTLQDEAATFQQQADFYRTAAFVVFNIFIGSIFLGLYSFYKLQTLKIWTKEWERMRYYIFILILWLSAVIIIVVALLILGFLFKSLEI